MHVLVTGGAGFIGSVTTRTLVEAGHRVRVLDDLSNGRADRVVGAELLEGDVRNTDQVRTALEGVEGVIHLARASSVWESFLDPLACHSVNSWGTEVVLDAAQRMGVRRLVVGSSAAVYGACKGAYCEEDDRPEPRSPYGASCVGIESAARVYALRGMGVSVLRMFNVYSQSRDEDPAGGVASRFFHAHDRGEPFPIEGEGLQGRDFVHVDDVAGAFRLALEGPCGTYNVGTGKLTTINELAFLFGALSKHPVRTRKLPVRAGDVERSVADLSRIERRLGWSPRISLEQGLGLAPSVAHRATG